MKNEEHCCGTCRWHWRHCTAWPEDKHKDDYWCANDDSEAYGAFTEYKDSCEDWEARNG